ncbi:hypothetical protein [Ponticaulis sp.]|uniref:hypothetical protein n=1 Tax=Ponticaulis sp. TaxID=2020902 RepID=UPI000B721CDB|nr:hypothetical protein [Ponticaulis sp.]MAI90726.1 hypothetical protein [Ponticaulis sp.]OUX98957.1 MAG: hypothetical protein CBB65_09820 [Hyphomonadaceae bacterium TMED5]|tara:strand:- start:10702 stop:10929 length:228 start_codon:yes stop_codon:yes gene_type:complete
MQNTKQQLTPLHIFATAVVVFVRGGVHAARFAFFAMEWMVVSTGLALMQIGEKTRIRTKRVGLLPYYKSEDLNYS